MNTPIAGMGGQEATGNSTIRQEEAFNEMEIEENSATAIQLPTSAGYQINNEGLIGMIPKLNDKVEVAPGQIPTSANMAVTN